MRPKQFIVSVVILEVSMCSGNFEITLTMRIFLNRFCLHVGLTCALHSLALVFVPDMMKRMQIIFVQVLNMSESNVASTIYLAYCIKYYCNKRTEV
jgi:hypothetical protein